MIYRQFFLSSFLKCKKNPCIAPKNGLFLFNKLIINYFMQKKIYDFISRCFSSRNLNWRDRGDGHYEFTGDELYNIPDNLIYDFVSRCFSSRNLNWIDEGDGHYEFTGDELYNIPDNLIGKIKFLSAPNASKVQLDCCGNLESFKAPKATEVCLYPCDNLESFEAPNARRVQLFNCYKLYDFKAPNATKVHLSNYVNLKRFKSNATEVKLYNCDNLESFEAQNATDVHLDHCVKLYDFKAPKATWIELCDTPQNLKNIIIKQLKNPQKLITFDVHSTKVRYPIVKDIAQDIKNADMELNREEYVSNLRGKIVCDMRPGVNVSGNEMSEAKKKVKCNMGAMSILGSFLEPKTIDALSKVNKKAHDGSLSAYLTTNIEGTTNLEAIKNYKKEHIVPKTHEHTAARKTILNGLNSVFI